jgi:hypothetical protein
VEVLGEGRPSLLFRPHPRDREWRERFRAALDTDGIAVQEASFTDFEELATLLQHCDCVVANAGTILLDALVERPSGGVRPLRRGRASGESYAMKNVIGEHYRELAASSAFYRAESFEGSWRGSGAHSRIPTSSPRNGVASLAPSSVTSTVARAPASSTRSRRAC